MSLFPSCRLPSLSEVPGLDIASRYVAASDSRQVGGDWFDVFDLPDEGDRCR
jgi:serine phosphatase RsbU (regulator of sigma subunit)